MTDIIIYKNGRDYRKGLLPQIEGKLSGSEMAIFRASTEVQIKDMDSVRLAQELREAMKWIVRDIGYRYTSAEDEQYIVVRFAAVLSKHYSNLTIKDVKLAFEMLVVGDLDERIKPEDRKHYGQLSMDYICRILNAYQYVRSSAIQKGYDAAPQKERDNSKEQEGIEKMNRERLIDAVIYYKYHGKLRQYNAIQEMIFCRILQGVGLIGKIYEPDGALINQALKGRSGKYHKLLENAIRYITENELQISDYIKI